MTELQEEHTAKATDGSKDAVIALLHAFYQTAQELPEGTRYDVEVKIIEHE
jgi:hypothetical protein